MANQMIALQARGPQLPNLGAAAAQYGNMMANMAVMKEKQAGIQRANAFRQLVSDPGFDPANPEHIKVAASLNPEGAEQIARSFDARRKSQQDYTMVEVKRLRDIGAAVGDEAGYQDWLARVEKVSPGDAAAFRQFSPNFDPAKMSRIIMEADQYINKTIATPSASVQFAPGGEAFGVTVGGLNAPKAEEVIVGSRAGTGAPAAAAPASKPAAPTPAAAATPGLTNEEGGAILRGAAETQKISPQDAERVRRSLGPGGQKQFDDWMTKNNIEITPMSFGGEGMGAAAIEPLTVESAPQIIQNAIQNGVIDQTHVEQLRQMVGPENDQALANWMRQNNITIQPTGAPSMRSAVYRQPAVDYFAPQVADDGMPFGGPTNPMMQQISNEVGTQFRGRDPMQSPAPGSAIVPLPRVRGEAQAGAAGQGEVDVVVKPKIAGGTKTAELQAQKDMAFPDAQAQFEAALATIDNRLADIKRFREHPAATRVIGPLDAFTPNFGRARGAQAIYDALVATATLDELQQMRQNSPTGGALGNVSDADIRVLRQSIGALGQDQSEEDFNESLRIFEVRLKTARDRLIRRFKENYGYKLGKDWQPPATSNRRQAPARGRRVGGFTVMEVED